MEQIKIIVAHWYIEFEVLGTSKWKHMAEKWKLECVAYNIYVMLEQNYES